MSESPPSLSRETLPNGCVRLRSGRCSFEYRRLKPGVILVRIEGNDAGQFGTATVDEVAAEFARTTEPIQLFIDTAQATGPTREVMETWTEWFAANRSRLARVVILIPPESQLLHLTISIARHLSGTAGLIRICGDRAEFKEAICRFAPHYQG
jgi:hypothetical protein